MELAFILNTPISYLHQSNSMATYLYFAPLAIFYIILSVLAWSDWRAEIEDDESGFENDNFCFDDLWWSVNIVAVAIIPALIGLIILLNP